LICQVDVSILIPKIENMDRVAWDLYARLGNERFAAVIILPRWQII
jgi:hypothetical protein